MGTRVIVAMIAAGFVVYSQTIPSARESRIRAGTASLYARDIGKGTPIIVLHGGPDFDSDYLVPDLDRVADGLRLIYYDQRGRGKSAEKVRPQDVTLQSDLEDIDRVREHFHLTTPVLLGHSWGVVLALEYALRHPERVSRIVLMNPAPVSKDDLAVFRKAYVQQLGADMNRQRTIAASPAYQEGDPETVSQRYRIHFEHALAKPEDYEKLMARMRLEFIRQGKEGIVKARAVEDRLMLDTWSKDTYDLLPKLQSVHIPTLVITGDRDFIPVEIAQHIAQAIPNARFVRLPACGHFSYMECPSEVRSALHDFLGAR